MRLPVAVALAVAVLGAVPTGSAEVEKTLPFEVDKWYQLDFTDGPVTLHRLRVARQGGVGAKAKLFRSGNPDYHASVQVQLEYSNVASHDWKGELSVVWIDEQGNPIDGYVGTQGLDEGRHYEMATASLTTLEYGLTRGRKLKLRLRVYPE